MTAERSRLASAAVVVAALVLLAWPPADARRPHGHGRAAPPRARSTPRPAAEPAQLAEVAVLFAQKERWDDALPLFERAYALGGDAAVLDDLLAACAHASRCVPRRAATLRLALARLDAPAEHVRELVEVMVHSGQARAAIEALRTALAGRPDDDALRALVVDTAVEAHDAALALAELARLVERRPDDLERRMLYATLLHERGRTAAAAAQLDIVLAASSGTHVAARVLRVEVLLERGELGRAAAELAQLRREPLADREQAARVAELGRELAAARAEGYAEFRREVGWLDAVEDLQAGERHAP